MNFLSAALKYANAGLHVLPLSPGTKIPAIPKGPEGSPLRGVYDASSSTGQIEAWEREYPGANIGLFPGRSGLIGLDFDEKSGGLETLAEMRTMHPEIDGDDVWVVGTPGGGFHYYLSVPPGVDVTALGNPVGLMPGLDIRNNKTYTILPPSVHPNGGTYRWVRKNVPWPAPLPQPLINRLLTAKKEQPAKMREMLGSDEPITERHAVLMHVAAVMRADGHDLESIRAAISSMNQRRCQPGPLSDPEIDRIVTWFSDKPPNQDLVAKAMSAFGRGERSTVKADPSRGKIKPTFRRASTITPTELKWLMPGYFPIGKCSLLWGAEGRGKSYVTIGIASLITRGRALPGISDLEAAALGPGSVAILNFEDDPSDSQVPRLIKCGADMSRVHIMHHNDNLISYRDMEGLALTLSEIPALRMVVIDPLTSFGSGLSDIDEQSIRQVMDPLNRMAFGKPYAVIGMKHSNKKSGVAVADRSSGGRAWTAVARSAVLCGHDNEKQQERFHTYGGLIPTKFNLAGLHAPLAYEINNGVFRFTGQDPTLTAERLFPMPPEKKKQ